MTKCSVPDQRKKQRVFGRSIHSQLKKERKSASRYLVELYTAIYESDDDDLMKGLDEILVNGIQLSRDQAHVVGTLVARSRGLEWLRLDNCEIDDEMLAGIAGCLKEPVHVKHVDLTRNEFSGRTLRSFLGHPRIDTWSGQSLLWAKELLLADWIRLNDEGDYVIATRSGDDIYGRFNTEDSTLSTLEDGLSTDEVEFLEELFSARSSKGRDLHRR